VIVLDWAVTIDSWLYRILPVALDSLIIATWRWILIAQVTFTCYRYARRHYVAWQPPWTRSRRGIKRVAVYVWYLRGDRPRYVGISSSPGHRASQHFDGARWLTEDVERMEIVGWYASRREALDVERRLIKTLGRDYPLANVVHNNGARRRP